MKRPSILILAIIACAVCYWVAKSGFAQIEPDWDPRALNIMSSALRYQLEVDAGLIPAVNPRGIASQGLPLSTPLVSFYPYDVNLTSSSYHENEVALIATSVGGTVYTTSTYNQKQNLYNVSFSRRAYPNGPTVSGKLPTLPAYQIYLDPFLDANTYGGGVAAGRIYSAGIMNNGAGGANNAIGVWHSDDGGATWSSPTLAASNSSKNYFLDKPALVVSAAANSLGWVYVIYSKIYLPNPPSFQLYVTRSTDGGITFGTSYLVDTRRNGGQQILVAPATGYVLALWVDFDAEQIKMSQSTDFGVTWQAHETVATATYSFIEGNIAGGIPATTIPMARFNTTYNRPAIVWHESDGAGGTDCYYTSRTTSGWQAKVRINDVTTNDQFQPSLAFDSSGTGMAAFYDRRADPANDKYNLYAANFDVNGNLSRANYSLTTFQSSADYYAIGPHSVGDYHQTCWYPFAAGERWVSGFTGNPNIGAGYYGDAWLAFTFTAQ